MKLQIAALAAIIAGAVAIPASASASTPECTSGTYTGYCGTQANNGSPVLVMDNSKQRAAVNNPVIGWTDSSTDPATDWVQLAFAGDNSLGVMFFWAPTGVNLDLCVADPGNGRVVLRVCNGSNFQRWVATATSGGFFTWTKQGHSPHPPRERERCATDYGGSPGRPHGQRRVEVLPLTLCRWKWACSRQRLGSVMPLSPRRWTPMGTSSSTRKTSAAGPSTRSSLWL